MASYSGENVVNIIITTSSLLTNQLAVFYWPTISLYIFRILQFLTIDIYNAIGNID